MGPTNGAARDDVRAAATVALLRDGDDGLEVLLTVRPRHLRFMAGATVFPGGAIAPADLDDRWEAASARTRRSAAAALGDAPDAALGAFVCALREAFEEVGWIEGAGPLERVERRAARDPEAFLDACLGAGVILATDRLVPAGRWVTPAPSPVRFDARFFVAEAARAWTPAPDPGEVASCRWARPRDALDDLARGDAVMAPPTIEMLQLLSPHARAGDALVALGARSVGSGELVSARVAPLVHVVVAPNPGVMTGPGTNTYVVGRGEAVVIDPAVDDDAFLDEVVAVAGRVRSVVVTHRHPDHVGGVRALVARTGAEVRAFGDAPAGGAAVRALRDGEVVAAGGARLRALHAPGHASDHVVLVLEDDGCVFAGDNVLGEGTAVIDPPDGDMAAYMRTLELLRSLAPRRIFPGHFRVLDDGVRVVEDYVAHRRRRAAAIEAALEHEPVALDDVVARAYADTPPALHALARRSALAQLEVLERDGRAARGPGGTWTRATT
ncbi:MAG TPA: MBL fold metallo-hydrolase [Actinomycetota bacterium]|nr:MBL fold metallo-hydrolase [Actinomycetota bacterium]